MQVADNLVHKGRRIDGSFDVTGGTGQQDPFPVSKHGIGCHRDDGNAVKLTTLSELRCDGISIHLGPLDVEQNGKRPVAKCFFASLPGSDMTYPFALPGDPRGSVLELADYQVSAGWASEETTAWSSAQITQRRRDAREERRGVIRVLASDSSMLDPHKSAHPRKVPISLIWSAFRDRCPPKNAFSCSCSFSMKIYTTGVV
jgi:hypothetical protein